MGKFRGSLSENGEELKLTLPTSGRLALTTALRSDQGDELIALLLRLQADMIPPVAETLPDIAPIVGETLPDIAPIVGVLDPMGS